ncbi:recombinase family protein, partial [Acetobacter sacchari]|nr:recombinase family protein [Acetobacter sacchari]
QAILDGVPGAKLKDKIGALEARKTELKEFLATAEAPPPLHHPNMAEIYHRRISSVDASPQAEETRTETAERLRTLVPQVTFQPTDGELAIILRCDLMAILQFAAHEKNATV